MTITFGSFQGLLLGISGVSVVAHSQRTKSEKSGFRSAWKHRKHRRVNEVYTTTRIYFLGQLPQDRAGNTR